VVEGAKQVWAVPRAVPGDRTEPVALHLLNRNYDKDKDAVEVQRGLVVRLRRNLFAGRKFSKAILRAPKAQPQALQLTSDPDHTTINVPKLGLWAILELTD
jgi:hypothetical protein